MTQQPRKDRKPRPQRRPKALRITRVYTRAGDGGFTQLVGGRSVPKSSLRIESYGTSDELSVWLGHSRRALEGLLGRRAEGPGSTDNSEQGPGEKDLRLLGRHLRYVQNLLFTLGGDLATRLEDRWAGMPTIAKADIQYVERLIDAYNAKLAPLTDFILPAGGELTLALHTCRVVSRRAERRVAALAEIESLGPHVIAFLNRLSDLFFVLARWAGPAERDSGSAEAIWDRGLRRPPIPRPG